MFKLRGLLFSVLLAFLVLPVAASAQVTVGVGGGLVSSTFTGDDIDDDDVDSKTGLIIGGWVAIPVHERVAIVPGAVYVQKGTTDNAPSVDADFKLDYVEFPVMVSVTLTGEDAPARFGLFAGPTFAFESSCELEGSEGGVSVTLDCDDVPEIERKSFDIGAAVGATVSFPVKDNLSIWGSGGVDVGLTSLDDSAAEDDVKNRAFFLQAGVSFVVGGSGM